FRSEVAAAEDWWDWGNLNRPPRPGTAEAQTLRDCLPVEQVPFAQAALSTLEMDGWEAASKVASALVTGVAYATGGRYQQEEWLPEVRSEKAAQATLLRNIFNLFSSERPATGTGWAAGAPYQPFWSQAEALVRAMRDDNCFE